MLAMDTFVQRPATAMEQDASASSWSDMIKGIETSKRTLPWGKNDFQATTQISLSERKKKERELDPISMTYRDQAKERAHTAARVERTQTAVLKRVKDINRTQYNMISHIGPPRKIDSMRESMKELEVKPARTWNMFSHLPHEKQTTCPILYDEKYIKDNVKAERLFVVPEQPKREFNVITNQFSENHEARLKNEYADLKKGMLERYWAKHDFDPVIGEYYDDKKEEDFRAARHALTKTWGEAQAARLPASYAESEGKAYDILTLTTKDEDKLRKALKKDIKKNNRLNKFKGLTHKQVEKGKADYDRAVEKRMNRVSYKRFEEDIERGYDFVTTVKGSITANNIEHVRPQKVGTGFASLSRSIAKATTNTVTPIHYAQGTSGNDHDDPASMTNNESSRHITGGDMSDRCLSNRNSERETVPLSSSRHPFSSNNNNTITPRSRAVLESTAVGGSVPNSARANASITKVPHNVPSLDLSKTGPATGGVRTGGLGAYDS